MKQPKVLIFSGYGYNSEEETKYGFEQAGGRVDIVHINDIIQGLHRLDTYQILVFPGGFSYGDDTGSGNAYAMKVKNYLWEDLLEFITKDKLIIGICNGFQTLVNLGLLPALDKQYGKREVALIHNDSARLITRWTDLTIETQTPWLTGLKTLSLPIAHGEGKFYAPDVVLHKLHNRKLIALRYFRGESCRYQQLSPNPNGSLDDIAGIIDITGKILGLMPHPERGMFFTQLPFWPLLKEKLKREHKEIPTEGPGLQIFRNAVRYFQ